MTAEAEGGAAGSGPESSGREGPGSEAGFSASHSRAPAGLVTAPGARATERALLREIAGFVEAGRADPSLLRYPVRIVVPSRSLREHLCSALVREIGGSLAGVVVQTSYQLAGEILETAGVAPPAADALFPVLVARIASAQPALREGLDGLAGGYSAVEAVVSDLLDAGFEPIHAEAVEELLAESMGTGGVGLLRARAIVGVATEMAARIEGGELAHRSAHFRRAREVLERDPERALAARAMRVHGFADATGVQTDFIEALVRYRGARVFVDQPPDPGRAGRDDAGVAYSRRFRERIAAAGTVGEGAVAFGKGKAVEPELRRARVRVLRAPAESAEVRAVANRIRALIDRGVEPERIGVVARDLGRYRLALRQQLSRLGVPFSALGERGPLTPAGRCIQALLAVLRKRDAVPAERWLEAVERLAIERPTVGRRAARPHRGPEDASRPARRSRAEARALLHTERADLRLALHRLGIARLGALASFDLAARDRARGVALPVHRRPIDGPEGAQPAPRRVLPAGLFDAARRAAARLCARLEHWPDEAGLSEHVAELLALVEDDLGWRAGEDASARELLAPLVQSASRSSAAKLFRDEFLLYAERLLDAAGCAPLGGSGGGVQALGVMEARARTFEHLFVLGLNRGVFPRPIVEDPLLSDALRARLRAVLPELPVKAEGHDEERFLFAELLSACDDIVLSRVACDDAGRPQPASPLLLRLRDGDAASVAEDVPALFAVAAAASSEAAAAELRPAFEHAQLAGLNASRRDFGEMLGIAIRERDRSAVAGSPDGAGPPGAGASAVERARARVAVLAELDPGIALRRALGPYLGFVGEVGGAADPRAEPLFITTVEGIAACPWQVFLKRLLRLEAAPDALGELPDADPRLLGSLTHTVLERLLSTRTGDREGRHPRLEDVVGREPVTVDWPEPAELEALLHECAAELARDEGIALEGFAGLLAAWARPFVESARACGWPAPGSGIGVLGVEVEGEVAVRDAGGAPRRIGFRADRVDAVRDELVLCDYKTGSPPGRQKTPDPRRKAHLARVGRGADLQSVAYALGGAALSGRAAEGRLLHIRPDLEPAARVFSARSDDGEFGDAFASAMEAILAAWDRGSFFPRLVEGARRSEPARCGYCEVKEACLRGDSGARSRLVGWIDDRQAAADGRGDTAGGAPAERAGGPTPESALFRLFELHGDGT